MVIIIQLTLRKQ